MLCCFYPSAKVCIGSRCGILCVESMLMSKVRIMTLMMMMSMGFNLTSRYGVDTGSMVRNIANMMIGEQFFYMTSPSSSHSSSSNCSRCCHHLSGHWTWAATGCQVTLWGKHHGWWPMVCASLFFQHHPIDSAIFRMIPETSGTGQAFPAAPITHLSDIPISEATSEIALGIPWRRRHS